LRLGRVKARVALQRQHQACELQAAGDGERERRHSLSPGTYTAGLFGLLNIFTASVWMPSLTSPSSIERRTWERLVLWITAWVDALALFLGVGHVAPQGEVEGLDRGQGGAAAGSQTRTRAMSRTKHP
jgi:hypothetical protein